MDGIGRDLLALSPTVPVTAAQAGFFLGLGVATLLWVISEILERQYPNRHHYKQADSEAGADVAEPKAGPNPPAPAGTPGHHEASFTVEMLQSNAIKCLCFNTDALRESRVTLLAMVEFGAVMVWFFIADRTSALPVGQKSYSRDTFFFVYFMLILYNFTRDPRVWKSPVFLNRAQTEEWKGWMQVLFLLYHYFAASELYNAIRLFIASYVWMTGFGNFIYYYKTRDYTLGRFFQMMWRLNFLVLFVCIALNNSYMLYYICPMHTLFTIFVYAALAIKPSWNETNTGIAAKIAGCFILILLCWDIKSVFYAMWRPFGWLVHYDDPRRPSDDSMYEWFFRSSLDRYVWIYGMICGWAHPCVERMVLLVDSMGSSLKWTIRLCLTAIFLAVGYIWYEHVYLLPKLEYNKLHPYTSWIPITAFIFLRNVTPWMRTYSFSTLGWLGCITLETYICQYHTWLASSIPDGQPVALLVLLPGYPLLNFMAASLVYVFVSYRLFLLTNTLKDAMVPLKNDRKLLQNCLLLMGGLSVGYLCGTMVA